MFRRSGSATTRAHRGRLSSTRSETARSSVELARESYKAGNTGVLFVLDAERQSLQSRLGVLRAQTQRFMDTAQLLLAMGGAAKVQ